METLCIHISTLQTNNNTMKFSHTLNGVSFSRKHHPQLYCKLINEQSNVFERK